MNQLQFVAPRTVEEAVASLAGADGDARVLAGGTDLLVQLRARFISPSLVVDVKHIDEMMTIDAGNGACRIGAAVSGAEIGDCEPLGSAWPGVVEAMELIGSTQIQGRASAGGNLCNASPAADSVPAMIAAGAVCTVAGPDGRREVAVEDIQIAPGKTSLGPGELVVDFRLPEPGPRSADAYLRFIPRTEMDIAVVGAGVNLTLDEDGVCTHARLSLCAVAPRVLLVPEAGEALVGTKVDDDAVEKMVAAARAACSPINDKRGTVEYRVKVAGVLARRATAIALERARSN